MIDFNNLTKTRSNPLKPKSKEIVEVKPKTPFIIYTVNRIIDNQNKFVYIVTDNFRQYDVLKWVSKTCVDQKVIDYIAQCYGLNYCIIKFEVIKD